MITIIRSASIAPGKIGDAIAFAHKITKYLQDTHDMKLDILMPIGGNPNRIAWLGHYENLAQWEGLLSKLMTDTDYVTAVASNSASFLPGSVHDDIWRSI